KARNGADRHTAAPSAFEHVRDSSLVGVIDAVDIDLHHLVKLRDGLFKKGLFPAKDAGATDEDVQPAKVFYRLPDHLVDGGLIGHIGAEIKRLLAQLLDLPHCGLPLFVEQISNHNVAAFFG